MTLDTLLRCCPLASLMVLAQATSIVGWIEFREARHGFSIRLPSHPGVSEFKALGGDGKTVAMYNSGTGQRFFGVTISEWPSELGSAEIESVLEERRTAASTQARLIDERAIESTSYLCREFTFGSERTFYHLRVYVVGRRAYELRAQGVGPEKDQQVIDFFDSFRLVDK